MPDRDELLLVPDSDEQAAVASLWRAPAQGLLESQSFAATKAWRSREFIPTVSKLLAGRPVTWNSLGVLSENAAQP